jgi:hypothetical protein
VIVNDLFRGSAQTGYWRPDVEQAYPQYGDYYSGYEYELDLSDFKDGEVVVRIAVFDDGNTLIRNAQIYTVFLSASE